MVSPPVTAWCVWQTVAPPPPSLSVGSPYSRYGDNDGTRGVALSSATNWRHACFNRPTFQHWNQTKSKMIIKLCLFPVVLCGGAVALSIWTTFIGTVHQKRTHYHRTHLTRLWKIFFTPVKSHKRFLPSQFCVSALSAYKMSFLSLYPCPRIQITPSLSK